MSLAAELHVDGVHCCCEMSVIYRGVACAIRKTFVPHPTAFFFFHEEETPQILTGLNYLQVNPLDKQASCIDD